MESGTEKRLDISICRKTVLEYPGKEGPGRGVMDGDQFNADEKGSSRPHAVVRPLFRLSAPFFIPAT
jgi:hypothetical protein